MKIALIGCVKQKADKPQKARELLENAWGVEVVDNPDKYFITTGFKELDKILGGWNTQEDVATIVARNGLGKSWVLFKCAAAAAQAGKRVGVYSGEMSEDSVGFRVDSIIQHISNGSLVHGSASVKNQYKNI